MSQDTRFLIAQETESNTAMEMVADTPVQADTAESAPSGSDTVMVVVFFAAAVFLLKLWLDDYKAERRKEPNPKALPGAKPFTWAAVIVGIVGALVILGAEVAGEYALGVVGEQSDILVIFLLSMIAAGFIEEVVFRGYLVVTSKGKAALIASIIGFSLLFTVLHPFFWDYNLPDDASMWELWKADWDIDFGVKAWFSSSIVFINSLWFYAMRFNPLNPTHSLVPCFAAHIASNVGVFGVKLAQGHVVGLW